jgi:cyclic nucleotide gated channel
VQCLKNEKEYLLQLICKFHKPLYYNEDSYIIREGEPLNAMLFITQGNVWCFKTSNGEDGEGPQCIEKGEFYGEELLEWGFKFNDFPSPKLSDFPISTKTFKTFTKVEAFALTSNDLKILVARHSCALSNAKTKFTQAARGRLKEKKNENSTTEK